jgi:hypothetical protein
MNTSLKIRAWTTGVLLAGSVLSSPAQTLWEAFNDHQTGANTHVNTTGYFMRSPGDGGILRNIDTGLDLPVSLVVELIGGTPDDFGANSPPNPGSPADLLFGNKCTFGEPTGAITGLRNSAGTVLGLRFVGLDPSKRYKFRGFCARGGNYNDRWSIFKLTEADGAAAAHVDGSPNLNIFTSSTFPASGIAAEEVALNSGENKVGSMVGWDNINPGADGIFVVEGRQYIGVAPFGNPAAGSYGYGFNAIYLAETPATGTIEITGNPENRLVPAGTTTTFTVAATSPNPISYRWQSTAPGGEIFTDIPGAGAASATYTTPVLTVANDNTKFRCVVTAGADTANSGEALLRVDGVLPALTATTGSTNHNAIYLSFSEPMALPSLTAGTYAASGGLTISSVTVFDPQTVKLSTSAHVPGQAYTVQVSGVTDVAGNPIAAGTSGSFTGFDIVPGVVSVEIWGNVTGDLASFLSDPRFPGSPDRDFAAPAFDSTTVWPDGPNNIYGGRIRAWVSPPVSGAYNFFLRSDNVSQLRISTDDSFSNLGPVIAMDTDPATGFQEPGISTATTSQIGLNAGQRYAIEVVWEEDNGADFCALAWRSEEEVTPADQLQPLAGSVLSYYGPPASVGTITSNRIQGGNWILEWTGPGTLQTSTDLLSWLDETGATSPFSTPATAPRRFAKLRP